MRRKLIPVPFLFTLTPAGAPALPLPTSWTNQNWFSRGLGQASAIAAPIIAQEGICPSPSNCKNNNPGALAYAGQPGATLGPGGTAVFDTYQDGYNALINQIDLYASGSCAACGGQPLTIAQMTAIYAPAGIPGNDPSTYAANIAAALGVSPDTSLSSIVSNPDLPPIDLSSIGLPDVTIDPTFLIIAGGIALVALLLLRNA
jgi:hypothetical protein